MARTKPEARDKPPRTILCGGASRRNNDTTKRHSWGPFGCNVYSWPTGGGVIIRKRCDLVELRYLGFDPLNVPAKRLENQDEEDEFCRLLKRIGGKWWSSERRCQDLESDFDKGFRSVQKAKREELREVYVGWPKTGGVLVLEDDMNFITMEVGMLRMVTSMEERCELLRTKLGAVLYKDPNEYPGFGELGKRDVDTDKDSEEDEEEEEEEEEEEGGEEGGHRGGKGDRDVEKLNLEQEQRRQARDGKCVCC